MTVGYREVAAKRAAWDAMTKPARKQFLDGHVVPVVMGPSQRRYVVDHHHLARTLADEGQDTVLVFTAHYSASTIDNIFREV